LSKITYALLSFVGHISSSDNTINKFFRKAYRRCLVSLLFNIDTLIHKYLIISCSGLSSTLITACTTYFLKNAPLTILGNSDLEVMITLFAISILPHSKMPFLIDVCLPVFSAVTLYLRTSTVLCCCCVFVIYRPSLFTVLSEFFHVVM